MHGLNSDRSCANMYSNGQVVNLGLNVLGHNNNVQVIDTDSLASLRLGNTFASKQLIRVDG